VATTAAQEEHLILSIQGLRQLLAVRIRWYAGSIVAFSWVRASRLVRQSLRWWRFPVTLVVPEERLHHRRKVKQSLI
jgi:hypothetical protein